MLALLQLYTFSCARIGGQNIGKTDSNKKERFKWLANFGWHPHGLQTYVTSFVVIILGVPIALMLFCYGHMCVTILRIQRGYESDQSQLLATRGAAGLANAGFAVSNERLIAAKVRLVKLALLVVLCFIVCWSPSYVAEMG